jgi:hypothetical protein
MTPARQFCMNSIKPTLFSILSITMFTQMRPNIHTDFE